MADFSALTAPSRMPRVTRVNTGLLYSARLIPAAFAAGQYDFFVTSVGNIGQGFASALTFTETNLTNSQRVPDQLAYRMTELGIHVVTRGEAATASATPLTDVALVLNAASLSYQKQEYNYTYGPNWLFPAGAGIYGAVGTNGVGVASAIQSWSNGWQHPIARLRLKAPLELLPGDTFKFTMTVNSSVTMGAAAKVWVVLKGESKAVIST